MNQAADAAARRAGPVLPGGNRARCVPEPPRRSCAPGATGGPRRRACRPRRQLHCGSPMPRPELLNTDDPRAAELLLTSRAVYLLTCCLLSPGRRACGRPRGPWSWRPQPCAPGRAAFRTPGCSWPQVRPAPGAGRATCSARAPSGSRAGGSPRSTSFCTPTRRGGRPSPPPWWPKPPGTPTASSRPSWPPQAGMPTRRPGPAWAGWRSRTGTCRLCSMPGAVWR